MSNFKDYANSRKQTEKQNAKTSNNFKNGVNESAFEMLNRIASKYEGASQQDLMQAIIAEATKSRQNGTLSDDEIQNFVNTISPMLNASQRAMLSGVINRIKQTK